MSVESKCKFPNCTFKIDSQCAKVNFIESQGLMKDNVFRRIVQILEKKNPCADGNKQLLTLLQPEENQVQQESPDQK